MSNETGATDTDAGSDLLSRASPVVLVAITVGATLIALLAVVSFILTLSLSGDVAHLRDQLHKSDKATKNLEKEIARLRGAQPPAAAKHTEPPPAQPKPSHIDAVAPGKDCVIRAGSKDSLADCLR